MIRSYSRYWNPVETAYHLLEYHEDNQHSDPNMPTYDAKRTIPSTPSSLVVAPELFGPSGNSGTVPGSQRHRETMHLQQLDVRPFRTGVSRQFGVLLVLTILL